MVYSDLFMLEERCIIDVSISQRYILTTCTADRGATTAYFFFKYGEFDIVVSADSFFEEVTTIKLFNCCSYCSGS